MNKKITASFAVYCFFILALFPLRSIAQEALPPVENVRVENGAIVWDPLVIDPDTEITLYNIYEVRTPGVVPTSRAVSFVTTVVNQTEFIPTEEGEFLIIASNDVNDTGSFSVLDQAAAVSFTPSTPSTPNVDTTPEPSTDLLHEIITNRCDNLVTGESCISSCSVSYIPTGGACRANDTSVVHQRARFDGYECIATSDVTFIEADVFCLK